MALKRKFLFAMIGLLALAGCVAPRRAEAQFIGYVSTQSTAQVVFTAQTANAVSSTLTNIGQSSHFLTVCNTSLVATVSLEGSTDGSFASPVTLVSGSYQAVSDTGCHVLQAGGYYPAVRGRVKNYSSGSTTVFYTGIGGPLAPAPAALSSIGPSAPIACDLSSGPSSVNASTSNASLIGGISGSTVIVCSLTLSFSAATTAGQVQLLQGTAGTCAAPTALYTLNITSSTPQIVHLVGAAGGLFRLPAGQPLCITTGAITAATLVDGEFAQISF